MGEIISQDVSGRLKRSLGHYTDLTSLTSQLADKASKADLTNISKGSPSGVYATLTTLQTAFPTGNSNVYLVTADGKWYYWNGSAWTAGGTYQSTGVADGSITSLKTAFLNRTFTENLFHFSELVSGSVSNTTDKSIDTISATTSTVVQVSNVITLPPNTSLTITKQNRWDSNKLQLWDSSTRMGLNQTITPVVNANGSLTYTNATANTYLTRLGFSSDAQYVPNSSFVVCYGTSIPVLINTESNTFPSLNLLDNNIPNGLLISRMIKDGVLDYNLLTDTLKKTLNVGDVSLLNLNSNTLYTISGEQCDFYNYGLINTNRKYDTLKFYPYDTSAFTGYFGKLNFKATTVTSVTSQSSTMDLKDNLGNLLTTYGVGAKVVPIPSNPTTAKNVLCIGDSFFAGNVFTRTIVQNLVTKYGLTNIKFVGRLQDPSEPLNKYEGTGGYTWNNYLYNPSTLPAGFPNNWFWDSATNDINIQKYMTTYAGGVSLDYMIINLGINNKVNSVYSSDINTIKTDCKLFLDKLHAQYPSCKVLLNGIHTGSHTNPDKTYKDFAFNLGNLYRDIATDPIYSSWVKYVPVAPYFDSRIGMQTTEVPKSIWGNQSDTFTVVADEVHPNSTNGYQMLAYADTCYMLALLNGQ